MQGCKSGNGESCLFIVKVKVQKVKTLPPEQAKSTVKACAYSKLLKTKLSTETISSLLIFNSLHAVQLGKKVVGHLLPSPESLVSLTCLNITWKRKKYV